MKQTFLLQEVIDDLVDTDKSLSSALIKLNYFGKLIKNQDLVEYTQSELNGYRDKKENLPKYRRGIGTLYIDLQMHMNRDTAILPVSMIEEPYQSGLRYVYVKEGIAAIEKLARETEAKEAIGLIITPLPMEMLPILQLPARKLYKSDRRVDVIGARLTGNSSIVVDIPNAIRTKLLDFVMSIGEEFGYDIEIESFNKKAEINNQTIIHQMNSTINNSGDGNILNTGEKANITATININKGNKEDLAKHLQSNGLSGIDTSELMEIIDTEEPNFENKTFGQKVNTWTQKMLGKALDGSWNIGIGAAGNFIAEAVKTYYGM